MPAKDQPLVSVFVITYNHGRYLADALEGIIQQKTTFPINIVVGEDCSSDNTREVLLAYAKRYPDLFKLILHEKNVGAVRNQNAVFEACSGKYVACCEGDDCWTAPHKLQKQVEVLEQYPELAMCTHETHHQHHPLGSKRSLRKALAIVYRDFQLYGASKVLRLLWWLFVDRDQFWFQERSHADKPRKRVSTLEDFADDRWYMSFCSIVMRRSVIDPLPECYSTTDGGHRLTLLLGAMRGGIYHLKDKMAVKRDQETSVTANKARKQRILKRNQDLASNNVIRRYRCLMNYASEEERVLLERMIEDYRTKRNL